MGSNKQIISFFTLIFILLNINSFSQSKKEPVIALCQIIDGDTIIMMNIPEVFILSQPKFKNEAQRRRYTKLVRDIKKAYPYAKIAGAKLEYYYSILDTVNSEKKRDKIMKQAEEDIKAEFEGELQKLTVTQGLILLKLIYRETGRSSYELLKELRGAFPAFFWQQIARLFGSNLKMEYDPEGEDKAIEKIVKAIEQGYFK